MKQTTLDTFCVRAPPAPRAVKEPESAKEVLEPLFQRPVPENAKYLAQLEHEYELIDKNKFVRVFLQVCTILELIRQIGDETGRPILHIIRGSAGSSLICYLLGITQIDPIRHGIKLARFMNKERRDMPDIDIDVPYNRREEIYGRIADTWPGMVARISNYCTWSNKTALRESVKEVLRARGQVIPRALHRKRYDIQKILGDKKELISEARAAATKKEGTLKNYSKHCGGIVIFEEQGEVPEDIFYRKLEGRMSQIKLNKDDTEDQGYIKIDILSNRGLAQLVQICPTKALMDYPERDAATEAVLASGQNLGITFGESRGMRKLFMEMRPRNVKEVAIALALIRPAAAAEGRKQDFLDKWKHGYVDEPLERPIIYDDDAISKIRIALRCEDAEADSWRKAFAKGHPHVRIQFRQRMAALGYSSQIISNVIDDLSQLIYYSFCKSHAISYAQLVWALAYWKAHAPHEFWAAALNHCHSEYRKWVHYREAHAAGLQLSASPPPYKVGVRGGKPALISSAGEQQRLAAVPAVKEFRQLGYWTSAEFLPGCGVWEDSQKRLDGKKACRFRGLIASGRTVTRDWGVCTLLCLGIDNGKTVDIRIPNETRSDLFQWAVLEGTGFLERGNSIDVTKIRGIALGKLEEVVAKS
jgi:DNA polymerase III alpha subunit